MDILIFSVFDLFWQLFLLIPIIAFFVFIYKKIFTLIIKFFKNFREVILLSFALFSCG
ncbi:hypothetical protein AQEC111735_09620 [Aquirufa ecclesiirivi]